MKKFANIRILDLCCRLSSSSLISGPLLMLWSIVCHLPHDGHLSVVARPHCLLQDVQWPWLV